MSSGHCHSRSHEGGVCPHWPTFPLCYIILKYIVQICWEKQGCKEVQSKSIIHLATWKIRTLKWVTWGLELPQFTYIFFCHIILEITYQLIRFFFYNRSQSKSIVGTTKMSHMKVGCLHFHFLCLQHFVVEQSFSWWEIQFDWMKCINDVEKHPNFE